MTFANLDTTDSRTVPGAVMAQHRERLTVDLEDGSRLVLDVGADGEPRLCINGEGRALDLVLAAEAAVRIGSHLAALGARELEPEEREPAEYLGVELSI